LVPQSGIGAAQIRIDATMKPERDNRLGRIRQSAGCSLERLRPAEIVGEIQNPVLETARRVWWRAFHRVCYCFVLMRLSILDRIYGPEPVTPADLQREADRERLIQAFSAAGKAIEPGKRCPPKNRGSEIGSHLLMDQPHHLAMAKGEFEHEHLGDTH
jgi:hypothetical protein